MNSIILSSIPLFSDKKSYKAIIKTHIQYNDQSIRSKYICEFDYTIVQKNQKNYLVRFQKTDQLFNDKTIHNAFDDILVEAGKAFWKLDLQINKKGEILSLENVDEIKAHWKKRRDYIELTYKGNIVKEYLDVMETKLYNDKLLMNSLLSDSLLVFFFNTLYIGYKMTEKELQINPWTLTEIEKEPLLYNSEFVLHNYVGRSELWYAENRELKILDDDNYLIKTKGGIIKEKSTIEMLNLSFENLSDFNSSFNGQYALNQQGIIEDIKINMAFAHETIYKKQTELTINTISNGK